MPIVPKPVYASVNKPLTIAGADRRLFFVALVIGGATFTLFGSLLGGLLMFAALSAAARWTTQTDPQLIRIVLRSAATRRRSARRGAASARARVAPSACGGIPVVASRSARLGSGTVVAVCGTGGRADDDEQKRPKGRKD